MVAPFDGCMRGPPFRCNDDIPSNENEIETASAACVCGTREGTWRDTVSLVDAAHILIRDLTTNTIQRIVDSVH